MSQESTKPSINNGSGVSEPMNPQFPHVTGPVVLNHKIFNIPSGTSNYQDWHSEVMMVLSTSFHFNSEMVTLR